MQLELRGQIAQTSIAERLSVNTKKIILKIHYCIKQGEITQRSKTYKHILLNINAICMTVLQEKYSAQVPKSKVNIST